MCTITIAITGQSRNVHTMAGIFSMDNLYLRENRFLVEDMLVNFGHFLPETSKSSACWDMGGNSYLTWLSSDSLYMYALVCRTRIRVYVVLGLCILPNRSRILVSKLVGLTIIVRPVQCGNGYSRCHIALHTTMNGQG